MPPHYSRLLLLLSGVVCLYGQSLPTFPGLPASITINETTTPGANTNLLSLVSSSTNRGNDPYNVVCVPESSVPANACNVFRLVAIQVTQAQWTGFLTLVQPLNALATPTYSLTLRALDSTRQQQSVSLVIFVNANLLRPPIFTGVTDIEILPRPAASADQIIQYVARDPTSVGRPVNYRLTSVNGAQSPFSSYFSLDQVLGRLTNTKPLQYSDALFANGPAVIYVEAAYVSQNGVINWNNVSTSTTINSTIYLLDQNLNAPTFDRSTYSGSIIETAPANTLVNSIFFNVQDKDRSQTSSSFNLSLDNYNNIFQVQPSSGIGRVDARLSIITNEFFNFNNGPRWYSFNILAKETLSSQRASSLASVNVSLIQVNRFAPQFIRDPYFATIPENAAAETPVVVVQAWDMDVGDFGNSSIWYRFSTGDNELFKINTLSGLITVGKCRRPGVSPCLDFETAQLRSYRMLVWAADLRGEGKTGTTTVIVNVTNVNDNQPIFAAANYYANIDDGNTTLSPLNPSVLATDADNDVLVYAIESGNFNSAWTIDRSTGLITATRPITYSGAPINGTYQLVISASDGLNKNLANVIISVKAINRFPPVFQQNLYSVIVIETQPPGVSFTKVTATDEDSPLTDGGKILYRILSGGKDMFFVDPDTGEVSVAAGKALNFMTDPFYNITIQAYDQGAPSRQTDCFLEVRLTASRPFLGLSDMTYFTNDSVPVSSIVAQIRPTFNELGVNPTFTFGTFQQPQVFDRNLNQITNPTTNQLEMFKVSTTDGRVSVDKALNANEVRRWQTNVSVTASNSSLTAFGLLTIWVSNSNKDPPVFQFPWSVNNRNYNMTVLQGANFQSIAGFFTAFPANPTLFLTYSLQDPFNFFELQSPSSGIIKQIRPINQTTNNYQLTLTATDNGQPPLSSTALINVIVNSVNQEAPVFSKDRYDASIYDDAAVGTAVVTVLANDTDKGDFGTIRYKINGADKRFKIDPETGLITVIEGPFNAPGEPFIFLEVSAYDSPNDPARRKFSIAYVNVTVLDANDHSPSFPISNYQTIIYTNLPPNSDVIRVTATDADKGLNAQITYSIVQPSDSDEFKINAGTGMITLAKALDQAEKNVTLVVQANDSGVPSRSTKTNVLVMVKVRCVDNCNPTWLNPREYLSRLDVPEDKAVNSVIARLQASAFPPQNQLQYSFARNGDVATLVQSQDAFTINQNITDQSANIVLASPLNYNTKRTYELVAVAKYPNIDNSEVLRYMVISVLPVKTFNPRFPFDPTTFCTIPTVIRIPKGSPASVPVAQVTASPNHIFDSVKYTIQPLDNVPFTVNNNGQLIPTRNLDSPAEYKFNIMASYENSSNNIKQALQLCFIEGREDQSMLAATVVVYKIFIEDFLLLCYKDNTEPGSLVVNLNDFLQYPEDVQYISYTPLSKYGFEVTQNGQVFLKSVQTAIENDCETIKDVCDITVLVSRSLLNYKTTNIINLKPFKIPATQPLTLITLNVTLDNFNKGPSKAKLLKDITQKTSNGFQCLVDAGYHTTETGKSDESATDVFLYTLGANLDQIGPMRLDSLYQSVKDRQEANIIGITDASSRWGGFNFEPVAIVMGLVICLLFLACLVFLCFCCWGFFSQWCLKKTVEKEPMMTSTAGLANRAWSSQLDVQPEPYPFGPEIPDVDILPTIRRDDITTVDGVSSSMVGLPAPTGYVHIEAPLSRSGSAFGAVDEVDISAAAAAASAASAAAANSSHTTKTVEKVTETVVRGGGGGGYENGGYRGKANGGTYMSSKETARAYSSRSGGLNDIDEGDDQQPVQLNQASASEGVSQIGAVLIRPETPRGQGYTQRIVGGEGEGNSQYNYEDVTYSNQDPARLNMAMQNEVVMNNTIGRTSYYDETIPVQRGYPGDVAMDQYANNSTSTRHEQTYVDQFEETRYL